MKSKLKRLGDYIRLVDVRNRDGAIVSDRLLGININKNFMPSVANVSETDLTKYKVIRKGQFAYSAMQVGRDETVRVSLYDRAYPVIISPAYLVFEVIDEQVIFPEFLMMWFHRRESDRYGWFISDSSVRASLEWDRFCDIRIPIPDIDEQQTYVALYNALVKNQQVYEKSLADLQLICDSFLEALKSKLPHERLGEYIQPIDNRNRNNEVTRLRGISTEKRLIQSKANMNGVSTVSYKIVGSRQFVYTPDTSRRGDKMALAFNSEQPCIVSSIYTVFEVGKADELLPEYLYLWFKRSEFDRYSRFHSWGSARETFDWSDMCEVRLPIPGIEVQENIVAIHHTLETRKRLNGELIANIHNLCPVLMRGVVESMA